MSFRHLVLSSVFAAFGFTQAFASFQPHQGPATWPNHDLLPQAAELNWVYEDARDIAEDLNSGGGKYVLEYKQKGGSSHQTQVRRRSDGKLMGIWSAPNHATYILGEIFAFNLARLFERAQWGTPGTRMTLVGQGKQQAFEANSAPAPAARQCNRAHILTYLKANPYYIVGAYMPYLPGKKPESVPEIVDRANGKRLNANQMIVKTLNRRGPQPENRDVYLSAKKTMSHRPAPGDLGRANERDLAKQLSFMTLIDALNSQRDRFGPYGSNLEVMIDLSEKTFYLSNVDDGGIADAANTISHRYFLENVSRFERDVFDKVLALDDFIKGRRSEFAGFRTVDELKVALGYETAPATAGPIPSAQCSSDHRFLFAPLKQRWDIRWKAFTTALTAVAAHMRKFENDADAFFE